MHAVAADDRRAFVDAAVGVDETHAVVVDVDLGDARRRVDADAGGELHFLVDRLVDVGAVDDRVRIVEAAPERLADGNARDLAAVDRVHHHELVGEYGAAARAFADAQRIHRRKAVGAELEAGADLADLRRLLEHLDGESAAG